jgi:putative FmdB family regulatory protein
MPTYDYACQACGHQFELFQSMTAKVKRKCPECGEPKLQRLIGPGAGFLFRGDGFYITDYRSNSYKAGEKAAAEKANGGDKAKGSDSSASSADKGSGDKAGKASSSTKATKKSGDS